MLTLGLPKVLSPIEFSVWQLYQLYALYLGYVTLGYSDGINLRLAGKKSDEVDRRETKFSVTTLTVLDGAVFAVLCAVLFLFTPGDKAVLFAIACVGALFYIPRTALTVLLQSLGRSQQYSLILVLERVVLAIAVLILLVFGVTDATTLVMADVFAKFTAFGLAVWISRDLLSAKLSDYKGLLRIFVADCRAGLSILVANFAAMAINGGVRAIIVARWGLLAFGQVSLAFQFASLFMVAINSIAVTMLPNLKRIAQDQYRERYLQLRDKIQVPLFLALVLVFPAQRVLIAWLPEYSDAASYLALLFPLYIYESTNRGLTAVFMKALRMERELLVATISATAVALGAGAFSAFVLDSSELTVLSVILGLAVRAAVSEYFLSHRLALKLLYPWLIESAVILVFLFSTQLHSTVAGVAVLCVALLPYLLLVRRSGYGRHTAL